MKERFVFLIIFAWLPVIPCRAQQAKPADLQTESLRNQSTSPDPPIAKISPQEQQSPRVFWVIPTFAVTESKTSSRLTPRQKLKIVSKDTLDPYTIGLTAFTAGIEQANNDMAGYGPGASGYAKRFGANYADQASAGFFGAFLFPSLLRQDPRYYRQGSGPFARRFAHALMRPLVTYSDSGNRALNWSGLLGSLAASGLSNAYYPQEERGAGKTFSRWGMGIPLSVIDHLVDEFGPDLQRRVTPKKKPPEQ